MDGFPIYIFKTDFYTLNKLSILKFSDFVGIETANFDNFWTGLQNNTSTSCQYIIYIRTKDIPTKCIQVYNGHNCHYQYQHSTVGHLFLLIMTMRPSKVLPSVPRACYVFNCLFGFVGWFPRLLSNSMVSRVPLHSSHYPACFTKVVLSCSKSRQYHNYQHP